MRRRDVLVALGMLAGLPVAAQEAPKRRIGLLGSAAPQQWTSRLVAFRAGLAETGYVEDRNLTIEYRWAEGHNRRLPALAAELVASNVDVIVVLGGTGSALAAKAASARIPVVFRIAGDPVEFGLVARLNEPGGNATGVTTIGAEMGPKQLVEVGCSRMQVYRIKGENEGRRAPRSYGPSRQEKPPEGGWRRVPDMVGRGSVRGMGHR